MKRRALLSTFAATSASIGLAGCGYLMGCRGVSLELSLSRIDVDTVLELGVRDISDHHRELLEESTEEVATADGYLANVLQDSAETTARDLPVPDEGAAVVRVGDVHFRVQYAQEGERYSYRADRLRTTAAVLAAATADFDAVADSESARDLLVRATEEPVRWCTRDDIDTEYGPVAHRVAERSGVGDWTYYLQGATVTAPARWDGRYYRADLWADTAE